MTKLVIFDCDGTLVDSQHRIYDAMCTAFNGMGEENPPHAIVRSVIGLSLMEAMAKVAPEKSEEERNKMIELFKGNYFHMHQTGQLQPEPLYEGIRDVVIALHGAGYQLAVATGKSARGLERVLLAHDMRDYFISLQTADYHPSKPHPSMVYTCLEDAGVTPEQAVVIGDTEYDMEMARAAGVAALGVDWGYHSPEEMMNAGAKKVLMDVSEILGAVRDTLGAPETA